MGCVSVPVVVCVCVGIGVCVYVLRWCLWLCDDVFGYFVWLSVSIICVGLFERRGQSIPP